MNINFLEVLYYIMSIIASSSILYNLFKNIGVSFGYEFIFLNVLQRKICKLFYLMWNLISYVIIISIIVFLGSGNSASYIIIIDFVMYLFTFYDFPNLLYLKINKLSKDEETKEMISNLCKLCISMIATFFSYKFLNTFKYKFAILQVAFFIVFYYKYIVKYSLFKLKKVFDLNDHDYNFKYLKLTSPFIMGFLFFFSIKLLVFYAHNKQLNWVQSVSEFNIENEEVHIIIGVLFVSILLAFYTTYTQFNVNAVLWYENKSWEILHITMDNYAICLHNNLKMMIKTDTIKTDYYCIANNGTYQFYEKSKNFFHNLN